MPDTGQTLTLRDVLRLVWEADQYLCLGNGDDRAAQRLEDEALAKAADAVSPPDDPPEFMQWLTALQDPALRNPERERIMDGLYDLFDPEPVPKPGAATAP